MENNQIIIETKFVDGPVPAATNQQSHHDIGARCIFLGQTRSEKHTTFGQLQYLSYEVYEEMAILELNRLVQKAIAQFGCILVRVLHSKGVVKVGQSSVLIEVATGHRDESFQACRFLIDQLKHQLPIWKREFWEQGQTYVKGCCVHQPEDRILGAPQISLRDEIESKKRP